MDKKLSVLEEREKKYYSLYKKYQFNINFMREKNIAKELLDRTVLESVDIAIKLNDIREKIYQIKTQELINYKASSSKEEKDKISELVELASIRRNEIEELFGQNDNRFEEQTNTFILYSEKLKTINSYLEIKEKEELLIAENNDTLALTKRLHEKMKVYDKENADSMVSLKKAVAKAMNIMEIDSEDEPIISADLIAHLRLEENNKRILEFANNANPDELAPEVLEYVKEIKKNQKKNQLDYLSLKEKQMLTSIDEILFGGHTEYFNFLYGDLLAIKNYLDERDNLRRENELEASDPLEFLKEEVKSFLKKLDSQIEERTLLDSSEKKLSENSKNIEFYRSLIKNSNDIKQVLGNCDEKPLYDEEVPVNEEEPLKPLEQIAEEEKSIEKEETENKEETLSPSLESSTDENENLVIDEKEQEKVPQVSYEEEPAQVVTQEEVIEQPTIEDSPSKDGQMEKAQTPSLEENIKTEEEVPATEEEPTQVVTQEEVIEQPTIEDSPSKDGQMEQAQTPSLEENIKTEEEVPLQERAVPEMEDVIDPHTIIRVDDASNELRDNVKASYYKFGNWFKKQWDRLQVFVGLKDKEELEETEENVKKRIK